MKKKKLCKNCKKELYFTSVMYCDGCRRIKNEELKIKSAKRKKVYSQQPEIKAKKKEYSQRPATRVKYKEWCLKNRDKMKKYMRESYKKNKLHYNERGFVQINRKEILKLINKICPICKKEKIKEIHHKKYNNLPKKNLKSYCKYLIGFCSRSCHRYYETNIEKKGVSKCQSQKCQK